MQRWSDAVFDPDGNVIDGATVTVRDSLGALATIYSDNGTTTKSNPFVTGTDTAFSFYAANGAYAITIAKAGYGTVTHERVVLYDRADDPTASAGSMTYDDTATYPDGSVGKALSDLFALAKVLQGTANQVTLSDDGAGTLTIALPSALTAPGSVAVTGLLSGGGTSTNDDAAAGKIGEAVSSSVALGSAVALTTVTAANVTSISLTAGDWDVSSNIAFTGSATAVVYAGGGVNTTSATLPTEGTRMNWLGRSGALPVDPSFAVPRVRVSIAATTTVYLVAQASFTGGTCSAYGTLFARRAR